MECLAYEIAKNLKILNDIQELEERIKRMEKEIEAKRLLHLALQYMSDNCPYDCECIKK